MGSRAVQGGHRPPLVAPGLLPESRLGRAPRRIPGSAAPPLSASATGLAPPRVARTVSCRRLRTLVAAGAARDPCTARTQGRPGNSDLPSSAARLCWARWGPALRARSSFSCCSSPAPERGLPRSVSPAAPPGVPLPEEVTPRLGHATFHSCAGVEGLKRNLGLGFVCWERGVGSPICHRDLGGSELLQPSRGRRGNRGQGRVALGLVRHWSFVGLGENTWPPSSVRECSRPPNSAFTFLTEIVLLPPHLHRSQNFLVLAWRILRWSYSEHLWP